MKFSKTMWEIIGEMFDIIFMLAGLSFMVWLFLNAVSETIGRGAIK
jgi:hypothetical protein